MSKTWRIIAIMTVILLLGFSLLNSKNPFLASSEGSGVDRIINAMGTYIERLFNNIYNYLMN